MRTAEHRIRQPRTRHEGRLIPPEKLIPISRLNAGFLEQRKGAADGTAHGGFGLRASGAGGHRQQPESPHSYPKR
jgi:hypothetical protein